MNGSLNLGSRSMLAPAGAAARTLADLGWPLLIGFTGVALVMWGLIFWLASRRRGDFATHAPVGARGGLGWVLVGGFIVPGIAFTAVFVATLGTLSAFPMESDRPTAPEIRVIGHQWWWEVDYLMGDLQQHFKTANEIHLPLGRAVEIELVSADVIHSFWVPRLHGKVDLIPGLTNHIRLRASAAGVYAGSCAEFCGLQHARMRFAVVAETPADFSRWWTHQQALAGAVAADGASVSRGAAVFMNGPCPVCHRVGGTLAQATVGPDLTHIGARLTLAAGWLPHDLATLHAWIVNAPSLKPGVEMPVLTQLSGPELHDLVNYLEALQ